MKVNVRLALATLLSAVLGGSTVGYAQQYYDVSHHSYAAASDCNTCNTCNADCNCQSDCGCEVEEETCDPWRLFPEIGGWQLYGFLNPSITANASGPASHYNGPVTFLDREEGRLNQGYFILERVADTEEYCVDYGGRVDVMYGTDYVFTQAAGWELHRDGTPHWNGMPAGPFRQYGLAVPQMYGEVAMGDLSLKVGHFYTIVGYQVVPANGNFFVSQPYTFQYGEPFTHAGALATWKCSDETTLYGAIVNGWDKVDATFNRAAGMGGFLYAPNHGAYSIFLTGIVGEEDGIGPTLTGLRSLYSLVFTYNISDNLQYVFQHDNGFQANGNPAGGDAEWYGVNQYLFYTINECWKLGVRGEWFRDDDGVRLSAAPHRLLGLNGGFVPGAPFPAAALAGNYYELAFGANWSPSANLTIRPELRCDWSDGTGIQPYDDLTKDSQFIAAIDAILLF